jgi:hypothetical protein
MGASEDVRQGEKKNEELGTWDFGLGMRRRRMRVLL